MSVSHDRFRTEQEIADYRREAHQLLDQAGNSDLTGAAATRFDELTGLIERGQDTLRGLNAQHSAELAQLRSGLNNGSLRIDGGGVTPYDRDPLGDHRDIGEFRGRNPWQLSEMNTFGRDPEQVSSELRARALSAVEKMSGASDAIRESATNMIEADDAEDGRLARHVLITSNPDYLRAWSKMAKNPMNAMLSDAEQQAVRDAESWRAMSLTDSAGGFLVPFQVDPALNITSAGSYSEITQVARQVIATSDVWNGVSSSAIQWSWDAEASEVSDDSPSFAQPSIPIYKAQGFVPISVEGLQDMANVTESVAQLFAEGQQDLEAVTLITGTGSGQPTGIVTALTGTSSVVNAATDDTFALKDVYAVRDALPAKWRRRGSWLANNSVYSLVRQFDTSGGGGFWTNLNSDRPPLLFGRSAIEAEAMDGSITTSGANHNYAMIFGDFNQFVVARRLGMTVELIPHLFGANRRPTGQRGWIAWYRVGSDSLNDNAFRMLDVVSAS
ncbi:major capsid protein [Mycolicibacterium sp. TY66]|uniref:phage major capsid protein n=1 Tax=unclassified Mycolicibacterium TaxID=2636767 RepID=UPI001BB3823A|nr:MULTISPECIES: phage major capsid protein [unclassified Mycolicibacterium]BCI84403.1 major capsid protein [Mycolicibacterium sp. TY66]BCJ83976.1 major capsid protein [Mycolicibacterium sp. TY81]